MSFNSIYGLIALISSAIFIVQVILSFVSGFGDFDFDFDTDGDTDLDIDSDSGSFDLSSVISPKGILHFLLGGSWYLVFSEYFRGYVAWYDWIIAVGVGFITSFILALVYWGMMKLESNIVPEKGTDLIGRSGTIYLPNRETNTYVIYTEINGAKRDITAKSKTDKTYNTGDLVRIISFKDGIYYIE